MKVGVEPPQMQEKKLPEDPVSRKREILNNFWEVLYPYFVLPLFALGSLVVGFCAGVHVVLELVDHFVWPLRQK